jgi:hypothetical protein
MSMTAGTITGNTVTLHNASPGGTGDISQATTGSAIIASTGLLVTGAYTAAISLAGTANAVKVFAASTSGGAITLVNNDTSGLPTSGLIIGTVGGISGVTSGGQTVSITESSGAIAVNQPVNAGGGNVTLNAATGMSLAATTGNITGSTVTLNNASPGGTGGIAQDVASTITASTGLRVTGTYTAPNTINLAGTANNVTNFAANITGAPLTLNNNASLAISTVGPTAGITTTGEAVTITTTSAGTITVSQPIQTGNSVAAGGTVNLNAAGSITVNNEINAAGTTTSGNVTLTASAGSITQNSASQITGGIITLTAPSGSIIQNSGKINGPYLDASAAGGISLNGASPANAVSAGAILRAGSAAGNISFTNDAGMGNTLILAASNGYLGGSITITEARNLTIDELTINSTTLRGIASNNGDITVTSTGGTLATATSPNGDISISPSAAVRVITLTADSMALGGAINAGSGRVHIQNSRLGIPLGVGGTASSYGLNINNPVLSRITAAILEIGRDTVANASGEIYVLAPDAIFHSSTATLVLRTGDGITNYISGNFINVPNLAINAGTVTATGVTINSAAATQNIAINTTGDITIGDPASPGYNIWTYNSSSPAIIGLRGQTITLINGSTSDVITQSSSSPGPVAPVKALTELKLQGGTYRFYNTGSDETSANADGATNYAAILTGNSGILELADNSRFTAGAITFNSGFTLDRTPSLLAQAYLRSWGSVSIDGDAIISDGSGNIPPPPDRLLFLTLEMTGSGTLTVDKGGSPLVSRELGNLSLPDNVGGIITLNSDLALAGDVYIGTGRTLDAGVSLDRKIALRGREGGAVTTWTQGNLTYGTFVPRNSTVQLGYTLAEDGITAWGTPPVFEIIARPAGSGYPFRSDTDWWKLRCHVDRAEIRFSRDHVHRVQNAFDVQASGLANPITLTRYTSPLDPPGDPPYPSAGSHFWRFDPRNPADPAQVTSISYLNYVIVRYSYAVVPIALPDPPPDPAMPGHIDAWYYHPIGSPNPDHYDYNWILWKSFTYAFTEDSNHNGRIDRLRLQAAVDLNTTGLASAYNPAWMEHLNVEIEGYEVDRNYGDINGGRLGYTAKPTDVSDNLTDTIWVYVKEKDYSDGGATPKVRINGNLSLFDEYGIYSLETVGFVSAPWDPAILVVNIHAWIASFDTVSPVITYALSIGNEDTTADDPYKQIFVQLSEPAVDESGASITDTNFTVPSPKTIASFAELAPGREFLLTLNESFTLTELAAGASLFSISNIRDNAVPAPSNPPMPKYPLVQGNYSSYAPETNYPTPPPVPGIPPPNRLPRPSASDPFELSHRVTDALISLPPADGGDTRYFVWPLWARDNPTKTVNDGEMWGYTEGGGIIWDFSGSVSLQDRDITLQSLLNTDIPAFSGLVPELIYAGGVPDAYRARAEHGPAGLWLPLYSGGWIYPASPPSGGFSNLTTTPYTLTVNAPVTPVTGKLFNYRLSKDYYASISSLDFFYRLPGSPAGLYVSRLAIPRGGAIPPNWYRYVRPFSFIIHDVITQRSGVTILNNVINPTRGEKTFLNYKLEKYGRVTIQVFSMEGTVIQVLQRGNQLPGEYQVSWDGKNRGGRAVARGMYFVRAVGPDFDEVRKVMVVK